MSVNIISRLRFIIAVSLLVTSAIVKSQSLTFDSVMTNGYATIDTSDYIPSFYRGALEYNLMIAASKGYVTEIQRLIAKGADIDSETSEGATPLIFAVSNNKLAAVNALLYYAPDLKVITSGGETALLIAVKNRNFEITETLIRSGADIDFNGYNGVTSLHYASLYGFIDIADLLLYYNASIDLKSKEGYTPLMTATWAGHADIADLLIQNGANMETRDNDGYTPFLMASYWGDTTLMNLFYKKGVNIYAVNFLKHDALTLSILANHTEATELLLKIGKKWSLNSKVALNPYNVAAKYQRKAALNLLKEYNVTGQLKKEIDQVAVTLTSKFNLHDFSSGISFLFKEPYMNAGIKLGLDTKLWYSKALMKTSENSYSQYLYKSNVVYGGLFKDYNIYEKPGMYKIAISATLSAGYSFGNTLKGTAYAPSDKFIIIPAAAFKLNSMNFSVFSGVEYLKTDFYKNGPLWFRIGLSYNYYFDKVRTKLKPIRWY